MTPYQFTEKVRTWVWGTQPPATYEQARGVLMNISNALGEVDPYQPNDPPTIDRDALIRKLENEVWPFLAHDPHKPDVFFGGMADAILALLRQKGLS